MPKKATKKEAEAVQKAYQEFELELVRIKRELRDLVISTVKKIDAAQLEKVRSKL